MKNILFVCALEKEGRQLAEALGLKEIGSSSDRTGLKLFESEDGSKRLIITCMGKQFTMMNLSKYLCSNEKPDLIINVGYAGSTDIPVGKWVNIERAYNYEWDIPGEEKYVMCNGGSQKLMILENSGIETVECYASESFVTETDIEEHVAFDMELHSISLICDLYDIPVLALKKISDNLSLDNYYENLKKDEVFELTSCIDILRKNINI